MNSLVISIVIAFCSLALTSATYEGCGCLGMRNEAEALCNADYVVEVNVTKVIHQDNYRILYSVEIVDLIYIRPTGRSFFGNTAQAVVEQGLVEMPVGNCGFPFEANSNYIISGFLLTSNRDLDEWVMTTGSCDYVTELTVGSTATDDFNSLLANNHLC